MTNSQRMFGAAIISVTVFMAGIDAYAAEHPTPNQEITPPGTVKGPVAAQYRVKPWVVGDGLASMASLSNRTAAAWEQPSSFPQASAPKNQRSTARKVFGAIVGAAGGFFGGAYLGAAIEGDCNCDDPGLRGAVIGAPIGAVTGGILGYKFLF